MDNRDKILDKIAGQRVGPFVVAYCQWIHEQKRINRLDNIVFLARDGFLIRNIYQILYPDEQTYYIRLSRKALRLPFIASRMNYQEYIKILPPFRTYRVRDLLASMFCEDDTLFDLFPDLDYEIDYTELAENKIFRDTYQHICDILDVSGREQKKLLISYLKENGIYDGVKVGLVEHSFKGTSQYMLEKILKDEYSVEFVGLYFYGNHVAENRLQGRFDSFLKGMTGRDNLNVFEAGILTERLIFEPCASVKGYRHGEKGGVPILEDYTENVNDEIITRVQKGALYYAETVKESNSVISRKRAIKDMLDMLKHPDRKEAVALGDIEDDNIKKGNIKMIYIRNHSEYLRKPCYLFEDFKKSVWRQGFCVLLPMGCLFRELYNMMFCISRRKKKI